MDSSEILARYNLEPESDYVWFDCEAFSEGDSYINLLHELSNISKGKFTPTNTKLLQGYTQNKKYFIAEITFQFQNNEYKVKLFCEEWFDKDLISQINSILSDSTIPERYCPVITGDQSLIVVFVDDVLKLQMEKEGIIDSLEEYDIGKPDDFNSLSIVN